MRAESECAKPMAQRVQKRQSEHVSANGHVRLPLVRREARMSVLWTVPSATGSLNGPQYMR